MDVPRTEPAAAARAALAAIVAAGIVALAVAMGIGRFAFTPLLPLMLRDGTLDAAGGAEWAALNYGGYLVGALTASRFAADPRRGLLIGLAGVVATTLGVGVLGGALLAPLGGVLRAAAGVFSAWTLVCVSAFALAELARSGRARTGAWIYSGVGIGIAGAGALAWLGGRQDARWLWIELGLLAAAGALFVQRRLAWVTPAAPSPASARPSPASARPSPASAPPSPASAPSTPAPSALPSAAPANAAAARGQLPLIVCYAGFGFGYIVPATFLPALAREQVADPLVFGLTWPLFGLAAALSVAAAARVLAAWPRARVWALAQGTMALGTALPLADRSLGSLAAAAVLVGGTFMVATMAGLQLAREYAPADPTPLLARMTVAFAVGQIAGPLVVRAVGAAGGDALYWAHVAATGVLALTALRLLTIAASPPTASEHHR